MARKGKKSAAGYEPCGCYVHLGRTIIRCNAHLPNDHPMKRASATLPLNG